MGLRGPGSAHGDSISSRSQHCIAQGKYDERYCVHGEPVVVQLVVKAEKRSPQMNEVGSHQGKTQGARCLRGLGGYRVDERGADDHPGAEMLEQQEEESLSKVDGIPGGGKCHADVNRGK